MITDSMRLQRFRRVLGALIEDEFGADVRVRWADQGYPRAPLPFVVLKLAVPPVRTNHGEWPVHELRTSTLLTVQSVAALERRVVWVNHYPFYAEGSSATSIRDGLVTQISDGFEPVSVVAVGTEQMRIMPSEPGWLYSLEISEGLTESIESTQHYECWSQRRRGLLSVNAHSGKGVGPESADIVAAAVMDLLEQQSTARHLSAHGVGLGSMSSPRDLSGVEGTETESRYQFDVAVVLRARRFKAIEVASSATISAEVSGRAFNIQVE